MIHLQRNILICLLTVSTLASTLMVPIMYIDFEMRKEYIQDVLCIQREQPITVCGGQCFLTSQLNKASDHQNKEKTTSQKLEINYQTSEGTPIEFSRAHVSDQDVDEVFDDRINSSTHLRDIFHPPQS